LRHFTRNNRTDYALIDLRKAAKMSYENSVYLAKLAEQAERYEGMFLFRSGIAARLY
jgi:hypothetical protein